MKHYRHVSEQVIQTQSEKRFVVLGLFGPRGGTQYTGELSIDGARSLGKQLIAAADALDPEL